MSWIIYKHTCPTGKVYIGQTCQSVSRRWREGKGYEGQVFYNAILKYGWENIKHEIIVDNIQTQEECNELEIKYIEQYKSYISKYGYNVDLGGHVFAKEHTENFGKHLRKEIYQIDDNLDIVREFESCTKAAEFLKISKAPIFRCANKFVSKDGRMSIKAGGYYWCWKIEYETWTPPIKKDFHSYRPIYQIDIKTNKPIERFENAMQIERFYGRKVGPSINQILHNKGNYITALNSYWCYVDEYFDGWCPKRTINDDKNLQRHVKVLCIDKKNLSIIKEFNSLSEASVWVGVEKYNTAIGKVLSGNNISAFGYYWCKKDDYSPAWKPRKNENVRSIKCIETGKVYSSASEAIACGDAFRNVLKACSDSGLTSNGKHWIYTENESLEFNIRKPRKTSIKVICIETEEIFDSAVDAANKYSICNSEISKCCKDYSKTAKGLHWCFYSDFLKGLYSPKSKKVGKHGMIKVKCVELDKVFDSLSDASRFTNIDSSSIGRACKKIQQQAGGYHWQYVDGNNEK